MMGETVVGYIYKITCKISGKAYIGKTTKTVRGRWKAHLSDSTKKRCENRPLYRAIRKYGVDAFTVETLEEVDLENLSEREAYWIEHFHTYTGGYNATTGGDGKALYDYEVIAQLLREGKEYQEVADIVGCCLDTVTFVAKKNNIECVPKQPWKERCVAVEQYTLEGHYIQSFLSYGEAARWLFEHQHVSNTRDNIGTHISEVVRGKRKTAYGFIWKKV